MALGSTQALTIMSTRSIFLGVEVASARADKLTTFLCRLSRNLGSSASWTPIGLCRITLPLPLMDTDYVTGQPVPVLSFLSRKRTKISLLIIRS